MRYAAYGKQDQHKMIVSSKMKHWGLDGAKTLRSGKKKNFEQKLAFQGQLLWLSLRLI